MSSSSTPRSAVFAADSLEAEAPASSASIFPARSGSQPEPADLVGALAQLQLFSPHQTISIDLHAEDDGSRSNVVPSSPGSLLLAGSDTSYDFDRHSDDGRSAGGMSSVSPQPSLYSLTDSLRASVVKEEFGQMVNATSRIYKVAANGENGLYARIMGEFCPGFREVLADDNDPLNPKACLDVGCGSGAWILNVAEKFPHVRCTAVDLVPLPESAEIPPNLRFEIDDVSLGLEHFAGEFNAVHVKHLCSGIHDYPKLIDDCAQALRPNGLAEFIETDWRAYDLEKRPVLGTVAEIWGHRSPPDGWLGTGMGHSQGGPGAPIMARWRRPPPIEHIASGPASYYARYCTLARQCIQKRGGHVDAPTLLRTWIEGHRGFRDVIYKEFWIPSSPWLRHEELRRHPSVRHLSDVEVSSLVELGALFAEDCLDFMKSCRPLFLATGVPEDLYEEILSRASEEIRGERTPLWTRIYAVYARKRS